MTSSAIDLGAEGRDDYFGYGRVDARGAVGALDRIMHGKSVWKRLSGSTALDTMNAIAMNIFNKQPFLIGEIGVNFYDIAKKENISDLDAAKIMIRFSCNLSCSSASSFCMSFRLFEC